MRNIITKSYSAPEINVNEILRYARANNDKSTLLLLDECISEAKNALTYKVCYCELPIEINDNICDFGIFKVVSKNLATNLKDCKRVIVLGATLGVGIDRLIAKYLHISPAKALMLQSFGAERIESLCDTFCEDIMHNQKITIKPRFSSGYGDLPLNIQKQIFELLNLPKNIGLTLNDSMLMSPTKSVTAFIGIQEV